MDGCVCSAPGHGCGYIQPPDTLRPGRLSAPQVFSGHSGVVTAGSFTPDGKALVTVGGEEDASLRVWNPKTGECAHTVQGHPFHESGACTSAHVLVRRQRKKAGCFGIGCGW